MLKLWIFSLFFFLMQSVHAAPASVTVLCYHTFLGKPKISTDFSLSELKDQMNTLKQYGYSFITLQALMAGTFSGEKNIVVIVDDGNISAYKAYQEVFKPLHIRPVFAIYPNVIGHVRYALSWEQLNYFVKEQCDIASHGYFHLYLTDAFSKKDPKGFHQEIATSKEVLEKHLGYKIKTFVYPFGVVSKAAQNKIKEAGYVYAFSLKAKPITSVSSENPWDMPRYMMTRPIAKSVIKGLCK